MYMFDNLVILSDFKLQKKLALPKNPCRIYVLRLSFSGVTTRGSDWANPGAPKLKRGPALQCRTKSLVQVSIYCPTYNKLML